MMTKLEVLRETGPEPVKLTLDLMPLEAMQILPLYVAIHGDPRDAINNLALEALPDVLLRLRDAVSELLMEEDVSDKMWRDPRGRALLEEFARLGLDGKPSLYDKWRKEREGK